MMAFSLALAGSVMVTVSVISIIPECLHDDSFGDEVFHMIPFWSRIMLYRICSFTLGAALYFGLSWLLNVPEPEEILQDVLMGERKDLSDVERIQRKSFHNEDSERQPFFSTDREDEMHFERNLEKEMGQTSLREI
jgi:hypothetical protein